MAEPITIRLNEDELKDQVKGAIDGALKEFSWKLRQAADSLDPGFMVEERKWVEAEIEDRVAKALGGNK